MPDSPFTFVTQDDLAEGVLLKTANLLFNTASDFSHFIEKTALQESKTCTQVILEYCDDRDIEPQDVAKLISVSLKGKIQMEMIDIGLLPEHSILDN